MIQIISARIDDAKLFYDARLYNKVPVGYIRINEENTISIAILPDYYTYGIATTSLKEIIKNHPNLNAEIYSDNIISLRLFKKFPEIKLRILDAHDTIASV